MSVQTYARDTKFYVALDLWRRVNDLQEIPAYLVVWMSEVGDEWSSS